MQVWMLGQDGMTSAIVTGVVAALAIAALLVTAVLMRVHRSAMQLRRAARRLAHGDLTPRIRVRGPRDLVAVGEALGKMAEQLRARLSTVLQQRNELGAVLSSMVEGVLAIDLEERIISLNRAAAELLDLDPGEAIGRAIQEVVRNSALQGMVARALHETVPVQGEITLRPTPEAQRHLQAQGAMLRDGDGNRIGAVIVLHDVTRLRRLESVRRDFVANVSHEIKTPVAAVKAAVETLLDQQEAPAEARERFLRIVARQADRLDAIIEDLLSLARIEQESGQVYAELTPQPVQHILEEACETCQANARARQQRLTVQCDPEIHALMNPTLIEQATVNLIDNAIKYSGAGTPVLVTAERTDHEVVICVRDEGRGIEPDHLPRVFERFYRTDKARSREFGGTGLGLSIVKHVAEAHHGRVSVDSQPGRGSTFRIHLQAAPRLATRESA